MSNLEIMVLAAALLVLLIVVGLAVWVRRGPPRPRVPWLALSGSSVREVEMVLIDSWAQPRPLTHHGLTVSPEPRPAQDDFFGDSIAQAVQAVVEFGRGQMRLAWRLRVRFLEDAISSVNRICVLEDSALVTALARDLSHAAVTTAVDCHNALVWLRGEDAAEADRAPGLIAPTGARGTAADMLAQLPRLEQLLRLLLQASWLARWLAAQRVQPLFATTFSLVRLTLHLHSLDARGQRDSFQAGATPEAMNQLAGAFIRWKRTWWFRLPGSAGFEIGKRGEAQTLDFFQRRVCERGVRPDEPHATITRLVARNPLAWLLHLGELHVFDVKGAMTFGPAAVSADVLEPLLVEPYLALHDVLARPVAASICRHVRGTGSGTEASVIDGLLQTLQAVFRQGKPELRAGAGHWLLCVGDHLARRNACQQAGWGDIGLPAPADGKLPAALKTLLAAFHEVRLAQYAAAAPAADRLSARFAQAERCGVEMGLARLAAAWCGAFWPGPPQPLVVARANDGAPLPGPGANVRDPLPPVVPGKEYLLMLDDYGWGDPRVALRTVLNGEARWTNENTAGAEAWKTALNGPDLACVLRPETLTFEVHANVPLDQKALADLMQALWTLALKTYAHGLARKFNLQFSDSSALRRVAVRGRFNGLPARAEFDLETRVWRLEPWLIAASRRGDLSAQGADENV